LANLARAFVVPQPFHLFPEFLPSAMDVQQAILAGVGVGLFSGPTLASSHRERVGQQAVLFVGQSRMEA
jgi:hypothetical protein